MDMEFDRSKLTPMNDLAGWLVDLKIGLVGIATKMQRKKKELQANVATPSF